MYTLSSAYLRDRTRFYRGESFYHFEGIEELVVRQVHTKSTGAIKKSKACFVRHGNHWHNSSDFLRQVLSRLFPKDHVTVSPCVLPSFAQPKPQSLTHTFRNAMGHQHKQTLASLCSKPWALTSQGPLDMNSIAINSQGLCYQRRYAESYGSRSGVGRWATKIPFLAG